MNIKSIISIIIPSPPAIEKLRQQQLAEAQLELKLQDVQDFALLGHLEHAKYRRMELEARLLRLTQASSAGTLA